MDIVIDLEALSIRADEINVRKENKEVRDIAVKLKNAVREHGLASLSAPQIGINKRMFVINFNGDLRTFVNPIIANVKGFELSQETCSSIPGKRFIRPRHNDINVMYQTPLGKIESKRLVGMASKVYQHCIDHLDGLLLSDVGLEIDELFDNATEEERVEVINMYLESLDIKQKAVEKDLESTDEGKRLLSGVKFMEKVQKGEIEFDPEQESEGAGTDE